MNASEPNQSPNNSSKAVLITGGGERAERLAAALRSHGHAVTVLESTGLARYTTDASSVPSHIDLYIQLPTTVTLRGDNLVGRVRSFLTDGLLARFDLIERLLPSLAENASVALVAGNIAGGAPVPDDQHSRLTLLRVLAHATRAELTERNVRVRVIAGNSGDDYILNFLLDTGQTPAIRELGDDALPSGKEYEDWRTEIMGLMTQVPV
jgi:hypothetical protein